MKKSPFIKAAFFLTAIMLTALSCSKSSSGTSSAEADDQTSISLATSATASENLYNDGFNVVVQSGEQSNVNVGATSSQVTNTIGAPANSFALAATACSVVTLSPSDPSVFPKIMTIDYGTGCTSTDGVTRKGKIVATLSGKIRTAGTTVSISFTGYSINGYTLNGTYAFTSNSSTSGGIDYTVSVTGGSISFPSGTAYTYTANETFTQVAGIGTSTVTDDTYNITGSFSSSSSTASISATVINPLVLTYDCKDITSGTIAFIYKGVKATLDFGAGTCDNIATITAGLTTKTITLAK